MYRSAPFVLALTLTVWMALFAADSLMAPAAAMVQVGQNAPEFVLTDFNGATHTLSDYRGKVVLLAFVGYA